MVPELSALPSNMQNKINVSERGCWEWTGALSTGRYGCIAVRGKSQLAHRVTYEMFIGPIPDGLQMDHLCRNVACCNPMHVEPVTALENNRRKPNTRKSHCLRGHAMTPENTKVKVREKSTIWNCRECDNQAQRRRRAERSRIQNNP